MFYTHSAAARVDVVILMMGLDTHVSKGEGGALRLNKHTRITSIITKISTCILVQGFL